MASNITAHNEFNGNGVTPVCLRGHELECVFSFEVHVLVLYISHIHDEPNTYNLYILMTLVFSRLFCYDTCYNTCIVLLSVLQDFLLASPHISRLVI